MAVENVYNPPTVNKIDPKVAGEKKEGDKGYWEQKRDEAKARLDYEEYINAMKHLGETPEAPFKVKGEINLGSYNPQEQTRLAQERQDKIVADKDKEIKEANTRVIEAENKLQQEKIENLRTEFAHKMDELREAVKQALTAKPKDDRPFHEIFKEQYTVLQELAKALGLEKTSTGRDPMVELELAKMNFQQAREDREFKLKIEQDKRDWDLKIIELNDSREFRKAELAQQARKDDMFATFPQMIGGAIAKGLLDRESGGAAPPGSISQGQKSTVKPYRIEVGQGQPGEFECPNCHTPVAIGPTSTEAQCVECNSRFPIDRVPITEGTQEPLV